MLKQILISSMTRVIAHPVQTVLSVIGIAIGIANIITLISLSETAKFQTENLMNDFGANTIFVTPYFDSDQPLMNSGSVAASFLPPEDINTVRSLEVVDDAIAVLVFPTHVGYGKDRVFTTILGTGHNMPYVRNYTPVAGRFFNEEEETSEAKVCALGRTARVNIFGDKPCVGEDIVIRGEKFKVVGEMEGRGHFGIEDIDDRVFIPLGLMQKMYRFSGIHTLLIRKANGFTDKEAVTAIEKALAESHKTLTGEENDFKVFTIEDFAKLRDKTFGIFSVILLGVSGIALVVAGIGIMNVMLMSVITRTREIGIRKAVGASSRAIFVQFLAESAITCFAGAVIGIAIGISAMLGITAWADWTPYVSFKTVTLAVAFSVGTGIVFGLLPAIRAARLDPIDALRYE